MNVLRELGIESDNPGTCFGPGAWSSEGEQWIESINPSNGSVLGRVRTTSRSEYDAMIERAESAARQWALVPAPKRGEAVRLLGDALRRHKSALGSLVSLEMGKIKAEGDGEVQEAIDIAEFAVGQSRMLYGKSMHSERPEHRMYEQWHPLGVVGCITAFNFPIAVWAWNAAISAICGNVTIWKPSPKTPLIAIATQKLCNQALEAGGFPPVFMLFNEAGSELAKALVNDRRVSLISFTGSTAVGRQVASSVGARLGKCLLELGGNNALIVDESADLELAVPGIVFGSVGTAGQRCTTTRRLFVHSTRIEDVTERLVHAYGQVRIGDPLVADTLMGPLIDEDAVQKYEDTIARARSLGGEVLCGGHRIIGDGHFVEPTIIRAQPEWDIVHEETFAPILYIMPFSDLDEVIAQNNAVPQGLSSALFTKDLCRAENFLSAAGSDCGIANINIGTSGAEIGGAFGGERYRRWPGGRV